MQGKIFRSNEETDPLATIEGIESLGHQIIARLSTESADQIIFVDVASGRHWKGIELRDKILNVACALLDKHDFKRGTVVCLSNDNSDLNAILALGIVCAGGVVASTFPDDPYAELLYLAKKVEPKFLFCRQRNIETWLSQLESDMGYQITGISMGDTFEREYLNYDHKQSKSSDRVPVACKDAALDVAMITMSSGTTGRPKAVPATHLNCLRTLKSFSTKKAHGVKFACSASLDYVSGRLIILGAIETGYTAIILEGFEPKSYLEALEKYRVNAIYLGAASFYSLITYKDLQNYDISSLKIVFPMGAKIIYLDELRRFFSNHRHIVQVKQGYGASELTGGAMKTMTPEEYLQDCDNCGTLLAGMEAKIVNPQTGQLLGPNEIGELHIKGLTLFPGYYDAAEARRLRNKLANNGDIVDDNANNTASMDDPTSCFVRDSSVFDEDGFYITGDLAYFTDRDELYMVGRQKELMSCRGAKKVLPQELEEIIGEHPAVSKVCVFGIPNQRELTLHCPRAFIVPKANYYDDDEPINVRTACEQTTPETLEHKGVHKLTKLGETKRKALAEDIMEFANERVSWEKQLTGGIVIIDEMPTLRATGKVDKGYLRSLSLEVIEVYGDRSS